ncbi:TetR/AcrR family transcriptional regulator [Miniphocaeibacter massiliensis]|uniref:TetR/AcrR family transcriptional regulator n=1 Tax=Miniphocaeibacter massiliensis TaxID=2041841 RepID=UPI000C1BAADC|nr:TetR/AcrR family transcriptional regulator [Miniphocaeibacter massiliensis]
MDKKSNSKTTFANSFKELMKTKPISKITVSDIVNFSNLSRQTFYRYFNDIDDLIYYIHYKNISPVYKLSKSLDDNRIIFKLYLDLMLENKKFYQQIISIDGHSSFTKLFYLKTKENLYTYMFGEYKDKIEEDPELLFAMNFYTYGFTITLLEWLKNNNSVTTESLTKSLIVNMPGKLKKFIPPIYQTLDDN